VLFTQLLLAKKRTDPVVVGGGAVSTADSESTGLNPQWRKDALVHWVFAGHLSDDTPKENEKVKRAMTKLTQGLGEVAGLDHAAYFNEANP
jgi:hypothetical protein